MPPIKKHLPSKNNNQYPVSHVGFQTVEMDHLETNLARQKVAINYTNGIR